MKVINADGIAVGRIGSFAAKEALKGEEIVIVNCKNAIITGNKEMILRQFLEKRGKVGSVQKGPKYSRLAYRIVKRTLRGMLPNHRFGRGREAWKRIMCFQDIPEKYANEKMVQLDKKSKLKFSRVGEFSILR